MRIDELGADKLIPCLADIIEIAGRIKGSDSVKMLLDDIDTYRGSLKEEDTAAAGKWLADEFFKLAPSFLRECESDVIALLATYNGVTIDEYMKNMTLSKLMKDASSLGNEVGENFDLVMTFFR